MATDRLKQLGDLIGDARGYPHGVRVRDQLVEEFTTLNGWTNTLARFSLSTLEMGKCHGRWEPNPMQEEGDGFLFDHCMHFRIGRKTIAIAAQPYESTKVEDFNRLRRTKAFGTYQLEAHTPPNPFASFWFPGRTILVVLTRPGVKVRWLPEQLAW